MPVFAVVRCRMQNTELDISTKSCELVVYMYMLCDIDLSAFLLKLPTVLAIGLG